MRKAFIALCVSMPGGVRMKIAFVLIVLLVFCHLFALCSAQSTSHFQSVSGDFAKSWLAGYKAQNPEAAQKNESADLWSWGSAPRGSRIVNGELVTDPNYLTPGKNISSNWLGDTLIDPYTGKPAYSYTDPNTGQPVYSYTDPKTGNPVYATVDPFTGGPVYNGQYPVSSNAASASSGFVLPPVFSTNDPWA
jgi:hypothetical protein